MSLISGANLQINDMSYNYNLFMIYSRAAQLYQSHLETTIQTEHAGESPSSLTLTRRCYECYKTMIRLKQAMRVVYDSNQWPEPLLLGDLCLFSFKQLQGMTRMGKGMLTVLVNFLKEFGLELGIKNPQWWSVRHFGMAIIYLQAELPNQKIKSCPLSLICPMGKEQTSEQI